MEDTRGGSSSSKQAEEKDPLPLHEDVVACRLVKNRAYHRALLLFRAVLCLLFLTYRLREVISCSFNGDLGSCRFHRELGLVAMGCEVWLCSIFFLSISWKWFMVERVTHPDRLLSRWRELPAVDVFVTTADPAKEPPLITVNTVLSALALHYPNSHKVAVYVSDDGGSLLTLWALKEATSFAKSWIPFCNRFSPYICPRAPGPYFASKGAFEKACFHNFSNEWHEIKAEYCALESRIISMTTSYCVSKEETLALLLTKLSAAVCLDGHNATNSSWSLNYDPQNHSSHCEILLEKPPCNTNMDLPHLVYISREKRPNQKHHFKAGAMNALLRVSGIMTNAPFILNLDCDMYVNDAKALLHAMCFFMQEKEEQVDGKIGFVQFPQCFEGVDEDDIYGSHMAATLEVFLRGMDGAQGPIYCGTGCIHKRESLYAKPPHSSSSQIFSTGQKLGDMFGCSQILLSSVEDALSMHIQNYSPSLVQDSLMKEPLTLLKSTYEEKTSWGKEVGLIYGSLTEDLMTSTKIHSRGWKSVCCIPCPPAFLGCAPSTSEDALTTRKRWSIGILEILFSPCSPYLVNKTKGLIFTQRMIYIYIYTMVLACFTLFVYALLPALSILGEGPIYPEVVDPRMVILVSLFVCINMTGIYENKMAGVGLRPWWNSERFEYIVIVSSNLFAVYEVLKKKAMGLSETTFVVTPKDQNSYLTTSPQKVNSQEYDTNTQTSQGFVVNSRLPIFIPPTVLVLLNIVALVAISLRTLMHLNVHEHPLKILPPQTEVACSLWVLFVLQPFTKGFFLWALGQNSPLALSSSIVLRASLIVAALLLSAFYL
eukprot:c25188_g1_i1 orf=61-2535(+)